MKELSIFIDESGDFGPYKRHSPYYIVTMVFHNQATDIQEDVIQLDQKLDYLNLETHCIHTGPIIRREEFYKYSSIELRKRIFDALVAFTRKAPIKYKSFVLNKRKEGNLLSYTQDLSKCISDFILSNNNEFSKFDTVKIYYDNGQVELTKIITSVFSVLLPDVEFRKVYPKDYKLFQVADMLCTIELLKQKISDNILTDSDIKFFNNLHALKKNYIKPLQKKEIFNSSPNFSRNKLFDLLFNQSI